MLFNLEDTFSMFTKILKPFFIFSLFVVLLKFSFGASLSLTNIGALATEGKSYSEWWYMGRSPLLKGTAEPSSELSIKIGDAVSAVAADSSGNWSYQTQISEGGHLITITQGEASLSFTLHMGQSMPAAMETTQSTSEVPITGINQTVAIALGLGIILTATYLYIADNDKKRVFEQKILDK